jgi:3-hydroxy-9,10-secoandrosta-1,3,5(10)-triene-9,17-dione monooxygenase reductase component
MGWFGRRRRTEAAAQVGVDLVGVDTDRFRRVLSHFCSGVVVVTAVSGGRPVGLTCQSFSSLSLDPPLVMFGAALGSRTWPEVRAAARFAVNILADDQEEISRRFARTGADKFADLGWRPGATGAPLLDGALAHVECELVTTHPGGDHEIAVGRVVALEERAADGSHPLLFYRSAYRSLRSGAAPSTQSTVDT